MIAIIDLGTGNLASVKNVLDHIGVEAMITSSPASTWIAMSSIFASLVRKRWTSFSSLNRRNTPLENRAI